jgi:CheY-like chemotaxis protein
MTKILVVDDNAEIVNLVQIILKQQGYEVVIGRNGREGMSALTQSDSMPNLILSNYYMPMMDGMAFLEQVRQDPRLNTIPFVMMSAAPGAQWQPKASELGADAVISKPFRLDSLRNTISGLLSSS